MDDDIHDQIEDCAKRSDATEIEESREQSGSHNRIDERMTLYRSGHAEMSMRNQVHVGQHGEHAGDGKQAGKQA